MMSDDPEMDALIGHLERLAKVDADNNARIMDNHLMHSDRVIASIAALKTINSNDLIATVLGNPT